MRKLLHSLVLSSFLLTSGCGAILRDIRYPGGYPGYLLDRHSYNASSSKELILLRATIILAMAARMGQATVRGEDADAFASYLAASAREINYAAADLYPVNGASAALCNVQSSPLTTGTAPTGKTAAGACKGYRVNFESQLPLIEARLIKTVVAALPTDKAREFLSDVRRGNVLGAAFKALATFKSIAAGLHYANGSFRSGLEIVAVADGCETAQDKMTVADAVTCLQLPVDSVFARTNTHTLSAAHVHPSAFDALMRISNGACTALPFLKEEGSGKGLEGVNARVSVCSTIWFEPTERPVSPTPPNVQTPSVPVAPAPGAPAVPAPPVPTT
jgi:hypothetical protein